MKNLENPDSREPAPVIDLREVPLERWPEFEGRAVAFPPDIAAYLKGMEAQRLTTAELNAIEEKMDRFYNVRPPWTILIPSRTRAEDRVAYLERA